MPIFFVVSTFGRVGKTTLSRFVLGRLPKAQVIEVESGLKDAPAGSVLIKTDSNSNAQVEILEQVIKSARRVDGPTIFDVGDRDAMNLIRQLNLVASLFNDIPAVLVVPVVNDRDCATRFELMDAELEPLKKVVQRKIVVRNLSRGDGAILDGVVNWAAARGYEIAKNSLPLSSLLDNTKNTEFNIQGIAATDLISRIKSHNADAGDVARLGVMVAEANRITANIRGLIEELAGGAASAPSPETIAATVQQVASVKKSGR